MFHFSLNISFISPSFTLLMSFFFIHCLCLFSFSLPPLSFLLFSHSSLFIITSFYVYSTLVPALSYLNPFIIASTLPLPYLLFIICSPSTRPSWLLLLPLIPSVFLHDFFSFFLPTFLTFFISSYFLLHFSLSLSLPPSLSHSLSLSLCLSITLSVCVSLSPSLSLSLSLL